MLSLWLCLGITFTYSRPTFQCTNEECASTTIDCESDTVCFVDCIGSFSCYNTTINCPENHDCVIQCQGSNSCEDAIIDASSSEYLQFVTNGTDSAPTSIYCPIDVYSAWTSCIIEGAGIGSSLMYLDIYITSEPNTYHDLIIGCLNDRTCADNVTMFCGANYDKLCDVQKQVHHWVETPAPVTIQTVIVDGEQMVTYIDENSDATIVDAFWMYVLISVGTLFMCICGVAFAIYFVKKTAKLTDSVKTLELENAKSHSLMENPNGIGPDYDEGDENRQIKGSDSSEHVQDGCTDSEDGVDTDPNPKQIEPDENEPKKDIKPHDDEIGKWLKLMDLEEYYGNFIANGYKNFRFIIQIKNKADLEDINIILKGHQKMILNGIAQIREAKDDDMDIGKIVASMVNVGLGHPAKSASIMTEAEGEEIITEAIALPMAHTPNIGIVTGDIALPMQVTSNIPIPKEHLHKDEHVTISPKGNDIKNFVDEGDV